MQVMGMRSNEVFSPSMKPIYSDFPFHHCLPDFSILVHLPPTGLRTGQQEDHEDESRSTGQPPASAGIHGGFGRLTKERIGGDALAEAVLKDFARRQSIPAILTRERDPQGYRLLTLDLEEAWSALQVYPLPIRSLVFHLVRKHLLKGLGSTAGSVVAKSSEEGLVLELSPHRAIGVEVVPPQRRPLAGQPHEMSHSAESGSSASLSSRSIVEPLPRAGEEVVVRVLNYNVEAKVFNVTTDSEVVKGTPMDAAALSAALNTLRVGDIVRVRVLLSTTDDGCAVMAVPLPRIFPNGEMAEDDDATSYPTYSSAGGAASSSPALSSSSHTERHHSGYPTLSSSFPALHDRRNKVPCHLIGYYVYDWEKGTRAGDLITSTSHSGLPIVEPPAIGTEILARVELVAVSSSSASSSRSLQDVLPFIILSSRVDENSYAACPFLRQERGFPSLLASSPSSATTIIPSLPTRLKSLSHSLLPRGRRTTKDKGVGLTDGLVGLFSWRDLAVTSSGKPQRVKAGETDTEEDTEDDDEALPRASRLRKRKMEEAIDAYERSMEKATPTSPEEFQRLLLASPNSSYLWTQWMAFHLQLQEIERARLVAEKAISTISSREEEEQRNVWVAYMNLENLYGTGESLNAVFKRALPRQADPLVLHERLADIFESSRKPQQLLTLCRSMTSKWGQRPSTWERLGKVLIGQNKRDQLKRMLKEMGEHLRKPDVAMVIMRLAVFEYKQGTVEGGRALFEGLIAKMPKKSDVWLTFIDQEVALLSRKGSQASLGSVRHLLDRAACINFNPKVMQLIFTKYMNFEKSFGTSKEVEKVKELARQYVQSKIQTGAQPSV